MHHRQNESGFRGTIGVSGYIGACGEKSGHIREIGVHFAPFSGYRVAALKRTTFRGTSSTTIEVYSDKNSELFEVYLIRILVYTSPRGNIRRFCKGCREVVFMSVFFASSELQKIFVADPMLSLAAWGLAISPRSGLLGDVCSSTSSRGKRQPPSTPCILLVV